MGILGLDDGLLAGLLDVGGALTGGDTDNYYNYEKGELSKQAAVIKAREQALDEQKFIQTEMQKRKLAESVKTPWKIEDMEGFAGPPQTEAPRMPDVTNKQEMAEAYLRALTSGAMDPGQFNSGMSNFNDMTKNQTLSAGSGMFDMNNQQVASMEPVAVQKARIFAENPALAQADQRSNAAGAMRIGMNDDGTFSIQTGEGTENVQGVPGIVGKTQQNKSVGALTDLNSQLINMNKIADNFDAYHLTYPGQAKSAWLKFKDKTGIINLSDEDKDWLSQGSVMINNVENLFNKYRKYITGAAASMREIEMLRRSYLNKDMGPTQFKATYDDLVDRLQREIKYNMPKAQGILPTERQNAAVPSFTDERPDLSGMTPGQIKDYVLNMMNSGK